MHRPTLGILAIALVAVGFAVKWFGQEGASTEAIFGGCIRVGTVLAVLWLALPDARRPQNKWFLIGLAVVAVLIMVRPKLIPIGIVVVIVLAILSPRRKSKRP